MREPTLGDQFGAFHQQEHALRFGMWIFLASEILLFAALFALYAAYRAMYSADFLEAVKHNSTAYGTVNMYVLLTSSFTAALAVWAIRGNRRRTAVLLLLATVVLGVGFLGVKLAEYSEHIEQGALFGPFYHWDALPTFGANRFFTLYWTMTGLHALHVTGGVCLLAVVAWRAGHRFYSPAHHVGLEMSTLYWHLVDVIWIFLWPILYLA